MQELQEFPITLEEVNKGSKYSTDKIGRTVVA
jgi:hypothetical protein